ncbi:MAG TPA: diacylglycerol kinase [Patescibacteria group bacterium]|nr:diacylglycerol kinase [Patescibacteria group bacterium]
MTPQSVKNLGKSFKYAASGFAYVFKHERNFRIQVVAAVLVIMLMIVFPLRTLERIALSLVITFVLVLELINTIMEKIVDILKPRIHHYVEIIKDMMAAAVLIASVGALVVGLLIFWPYLF